MASVTFVVSQISSIAFGAIGMPLAILGLIYAMTISYNRSVQVGAIIPSILWILYQFNGFFAFNLNWLFRVVIILVMAIIAIGTTFIKWKKWPTFLLSCLLTLICVLAIIFSSMNDDTAFYCVSIVITIAVTIFYYAIINFLNKWLAHMTKIAKQGVYVDKHYLIPNVLNEYFKQFIEKNNVSQALIVTFNIPDESDKDLVLETIYQTFKNQKVMFFKSSYSAYGIILTGHKYYISNLNNSYLGNTKRLRMNNDDLKLLEQQILSVNNIDVSVSAYVSIYGVHSCKLESLLKNNDYAFKHDDAMKNHNVVQLFNTNIRNQEIVDHAAFVTLSQKINLDEINIELEIIKMNKTRQLYVCPRYFWPKKLTCDTNSIIKEVGQLIGDALLRYLANESLKLYVKNNKYKGIPLLLYYPINQLNSSHWTINEFIKKINLYDVDRSKIVLSFSVKNFKQLPKQIYSNLLELQENNIKYILVDVLDINILKGLKPEGIALSKVSKNKSINNRLANKFKINIL